MCSRIREQARSHICLMWPLKIIIHRSVEHAVGDVFRRVGVCLECRSGPGGQHAVGVVAPGRLGLRFFRHRCNGSDAGDWRAAGREDFQPFGGALRHGELDAPVPVGRGAVDRSAGAVTELSDLAGAAADDRGDPDHRVHPRRELDQSTGGRALARSPGGALRQQLCVEPTVGSVAAGRVGYRT